MFDEIPMNGQGDSMALTKKTKKGLQIVPAEQARVLASYLISLKRDDQMPESMDHGRKEEAEAK